MSRLKKVLIEMWMFLDKFLRWVDSAKRSIKD